MSGIFIPFHPRNSHERFAVLPGGPPHVTILYVPKPQRGSVDLTSMAKRVLDDGVQQAVFNKIEINSFMHEGEGKMRYDVFAIPDDETKAYLVYLRRKLGVPDAEVRLHMTLGSFWTERRARAQQRQWTTALPITGNFTGVAID